MARIEWVKLRLNNWALWRARQDSGGLGFYTSSSFLHEAAQGGYRESIIPVDECDAEVTNQAVESLRMTKSHLYATLQSFYIKGLGVSGTARHLGKAASTIHSNLDQADLALSAWFAERYERQRRVITT